MPYLRGVIGLDHLGLRVYRPTVCRNKGYKSSHYKCVDIQVLS